MSATLPLLMLAPALVCAVSLFLRVKPRRMVRVRWHRFGGVS